LSLAEGRFVAIALWLHREWPAGEVFVEFKRGAAASSGAPFDALTAPGEAPWFTPLADKPTLRSAFLDWLALRPPCAESRAAASDAE